MREIHIYTDGSCDIHHADRPGGWAAILIDVKTDTQKEIKGPEAGPKLGTTNNEMEITAVIEALRAIAINGGPHSITIRTDSQYLIGAMSGNKRKKNRELLEQLDRLVEQHKVRFEHVKGHSGDEYNERVHWLAVQARDNR